MRGFFETPVEYLKGVGPQRSALLNKELKIFTFGNLLQYYPFRYEDRTKFYSIKNLIDETPYVQVKGTIISKELIGVGHKKRLVALLKDETGSIELVWFQGIKWMQEKIKPGIEYVVFGKPVLYGKKFNMAHPEIEPLTSKNEKGGYFHPVYPLTERLKSKFVDSKVISKLQQELLVLAKDKIRETLPASLLKQFKFIDKQQALVNIHFPQSLELLNQAQQRLKFEELFYIQLRLLKMKLVRQDKFKGLIFNDATLLTKFYNEFLPFQLTEAQKKSNQRNLF